MALMSKLSDTVKPKSFSLNHFHKAKGFFLFKLTEVLVQFDNESKICM